MSAYESQVVVAIMAIVVVLGFSATFLFRFLPQDPALQAHHSRRYFALYFFMLSVAFVTFAIRNFVPEVVSIALNNLIYLFGAYCMLYGFKLRRNPQGAHIFSEPYFYLNASALLVANVAIFFYFYDSIFARSLILNVNMGVIGLYSLRYIPKNPQQVSRGERLTRNILTICVVLTFSVPVCFYVVKTFTAFLLFAVSLQLLQVNLVMAGIFMLLLSEIVEHHYANSMTDAMTGLNNRRYFVEHVSDVIDEHAFGSLILADVDHFKSINDQYGHEVGDTVLVKFGEILRRHVRTQDILARIGGEEFAIYLPNTDAHTAQKIADRMRENVSQIKLYALGHDLSCTASFGVATFEQPAPLNEIMSRADRAMYSAKEQGRNLVVAA